MSKRFGYFFLGLVLITALVITALFGALHTQYATPLVNQLLSTYSAQKITVEHASYQAPLEFSFEGITIGEQEPVYLPKVNLWLSAALPHNDQIQLDALVIEEANLNLNHLASLQQLPLVTKQLAIDYSDLSWGEMSARQVKVQINHPQWQESQRIPFGDIQFSSEQVYWHGQALDKLLLNIDYKSSNSTIYGASFNWNGAQISGQAEQYPQGWSLINVTIKQLNLTDGDKQLAWLNELNPSNWIRDINSLDLLNSNIRYHGVELQNLDLSLENWVLNKGWWQQEKSYLSFDADTLIYQQQQLVEPSANLYFTPNKIELAEFDSDWQQGRIQLNASYSPDALNIRNLSLSGIKWLDVNAQQLGQLENWGQSLQQIEIANIKVHNAQIIQLNQRPFWQVSGFNAQGYDLSLKQNGRWGLWHGNLQLTANSASYNHYLTTQAIVEMSNQHKVWQLDRLFMPLESGYIEASGQWDRAPISAPWQLDLTIDGLPLNQEIDTAPQPMQVKMVSDISAQLSGLAGDYSMLAHSLTGQAQITLREGYLTLGDTQQKAQFEQAFSLDTLKITADRGRISIDSLPSASGTQLAGKMDLADTQLATLLLQSQHNCQHLQADLTAKVYQLTQRCQPQVPKQIVSQASAQDATRESCN